MFSNLFKKKEKNNEILAVVDGQLMSLEHSEDEVFKDKMMGDGFFIKPESEKIYSPVSGTISSFFPTKHAFTILSDNNVDILIHIGRNTVELEGRPFDINLVEGQKIKAGELIGTVNFKEIIEAGKGTEVYVLFPELTEINNFSIEDEKQLLHGEVVVKFKY
ncbi:PTS sugar transporter subunit IIA [Clostridium intestinale]|uniref:PTS system transporter subunit IIBC n=1 Tax=Clostridium intestinale URNW TaxID=1294142 RepID=U2NJQ0_9CLOT|nr:PTS glucose transporter subunit IIA [Clostridium intestinale]ERK29383.1 PTS system transporter subunit IIBC [Clostridium intestinale URNW]